MCWPLNTIGALFILPESFPNAMTEPENVIAPTNVPMNSSSLLPSGIGSAIPSAAGLLTAAMAISTAAMPTSECIAATSSGICVICTRRATKAPMPPPMTRPRMITSSRLVSTSVTTTATTIPMIPSMLPRRAVVGAESPFKARMNRTEATRYQSASRLADMDGRP